MKQPANVKTEVKYAIMIDGEIWQQMYFCGPSEAKDHWNFHKKECDCNKGLAGRLVKVTVISVLSETGIEYK